jgi:hypothetical protein
VIRTIRENVTMLSGFDSKIDKIKHWHFGCAALCVILPFYAVWIPILFPDTVFWV